MYPHPIQSVGVKVEVESPASPVYVSSDGCVTLHATWLGPQHHAIHIQIYIYIYTSLYYLYIYVFTPLLTANPEGGGQ